MMVSYLLALVVVLAGGVGPGPGGLIGPGVVIVFPP
jgi:hypothetical protein